MPVNIKEIVKIQEHTSKEYGAFEYIINQNYKSINKAYTEILLAKTSEVEYQLEQWVLDNNAKDLFITLERKNSSGGDLVYFGFWDVQVNLKDKSGASLAEEESDLKLDSLNSFFRHFHTLEHNYKTNEINSAKGNVFTIPLNDLSKLYDFFLPEEYLKEYRLEQLELKLEKNNTNKPTKTTKNKI